MAPTAKKTVTSSSALVKEPAVILVELLSRVFKLCIYYPDGNALLEQTAASFIEELRAIEPTENSVKIKIDPICCFVAEKAVGLESKASSELHKLFTHTGIRMVEFEKSLLPNHLTQFAKKLLSWRIESEASDSFVGFDVSSLPAPIHIKQQEFIVDPSRDTHDDDDGEESASLKEICEKLSAKGLKKEEVEQCRSLLLTLSKPSQEKKLQTASFPNASWQDIQALLLQVFSQPRTPKNKRQESDKQTDVNTISSIFESLGRGLEDERSKEAIQLLLSNLKGEKEAEKAVVRKQPAEGGIKSEDLKNMRKHSVKSVISIKQINKYIYENNIPLKIQKNLTKVDRSEELAINLQLLSTASEKELLPVIESDINAILQTPLTDREKLVLLGGIKDLIRADNLGQLYTLLGDIIPLFRVHEVDGSLSVLVDIYDSLPQQERSLLWPVMVNEILAVGSENESEKFVEITKRASQISSAGMSAMSIHLDLLDAFKKSALAPVVFIPDYIYSYPMFSFLVDTSIGKYVAERVLLGLIDDPQDKVIAITGPLLDLEIKEHDEFLKSYLMQAHHEEPPLVLRMAAGQIICEHLQRIAEGNKEDENLAEIILVTAELNCRETREILERIINEKKLGLLHVWPKDCRKAAWTALKSIQRKRQ